MPPPDRAHDHHPLWSVTGSRDVSGAQHQVCDHYVQLREPPRARGGGEGGRDVVNREVGRSEESREHKGFFWVELRAIAINAQGLQLEHLCRQCLIGGMMQENVSGP